MRTTRGRARLIWEYVDARIRRQTATDTPREASPDGDFDGLIDLTRELSRIDIVPPRAAEDAVLQRLARDVASGAVRPRRTWLPSGWHVSGGGSHDEVPRGLSLRPAYGTSFTNAEGLVQIFDTSLTFRTLQGTTLSMPLKPKMIQDEMGEAFELEYGRMSGFLGVETPNAQAGLQNMILHPYTYPPDEILDGIELPTGVAVTPIASADDGTQIWKFTHQRRRHAPDPLPPV